MVEVLGEAVVAADIDLAPFLAVERSPFVEAKDWELLVPPCVGLW